MSHETWVIVSATCRTFLWGITLTQTQVDKIYQEKECLKVDMGMDQYLLIPFLGG
jgi:hypothetical protein